MCNTWKTLYEYNALVGRLEAESDVPVEWNVILKWILKEYIVKVEIL